MARPKKQTVDYFPHDAVSGKTLFILENAFGNDGYAFWFKLLEMLCTTEGHVYDTRNPSAWRFLIAKTRVSESLGRQILDLLAELGAIDTQLWQNGLIWSQHLVDNLADVYLKRKCDSPKKPEIPSSESFRTENPLKSEIDSSFCDGNSSNIESAIVSDSENPQSKVKETKVNKTKLEERKETKKSTPLSSFPTPIHESIFNQLGETTYKTWFSDSTIEVNGDLILISVSGNFKKQAIQKYLEQIRILTGKQVSVKDLVEEGGMKQCE
jgi:Fe-S cluster biosynthesis and repair protein YggX